MVYYVQKSNNYYQKCYKNGKKVRVSRKEYMAKTRMRGGFFKSKLHQHLNNLNKGVKGAKEKAKAHLNALHAKATGMDNNHHDLKNHHDVQQMSQKDAQTVIANEHAVIKKKPNNNSTNNPTADLHQYINNGAPDHNADAEPGGGPPSGNNSNNKKNTSSNNKPSTSSENNNNFSCTIL